MRQEDLDKVLTEMREENEKRKRVYHRELNALNERISGLRQMAHSLTSESYRIDQQRRIVARELAVGQEAYEEKRNELIAKYKPTTHRNLEELSDYTLVRELRARGWGGELFSVDGLMNLEHVRNVNAVLNGMNPDGLGDGQQTTDNGQQTTDGA